MGQAIRPSQGSRGGVAIVAAAASLLDFNFFFFTLKSKDIAAGAQTASPPLLGELCWDFNTHTHTPKRSSGEPNPGELELSVLFVGCCEECACVWSVLGGEEE